MLLVYDCEIEKAIQSRGESKIDGIEYCAGWSDYKGMGISCIGAYDFVEARYRMFLKDNFADFQALLDSRSILVGFNSISFDNPLLCANGFTLPETLEHYDILVETRKAAGPSARSHVPGYKLDDLASLNLNAGKSGSGAHAPVQWQRGEFGSVIDYCLNDVKVTVGLLQKIIVDGILKGPGGRILTIRKPF